MWEKPKPTGLSGIGKIRGLIDKLVEIQKADAVEKMKNLTKVMEAKKNSELNDASNK